MVWKHMSWSLVAASLLVCQCVLAADKPTEAADKVDKVPVSTPTTTAVSPSTNDLNIPQNLMQILSNGGAVAVGLAVVAALVAMAMPMFGIRYCQLLGNCDNQAYPYSAANNVYQSDMYAQYPQPSYPATNTYQKRSVEYVGPVIQMLKTAYDRYGQNSLVTPKKVS